MVLRLHFLDAIARHSYSLLRYFITATVTVTFHLSGQSRPKIESTYLFVLFWVLFWLGICRHHHGISHRRGHITTLCTACLASLLLSLLSLLLEEQWQLSWVARQ
jgi:hypothetical protein